MQNQSTIPIKQWFGGTFTGHEDYLSESPAHFSSEWKKKEEKFVLPDSDFIGINQKIPIRRPSGVLTVCNFS